MKKIIILLLSIAIILNVYFIYKHYKNNQLCYETNTLPTLNEKKIDIIEGEHQNKIKIYFPYTKYKKLNKAIEAKMNYYINDFKKYIVNREIKPNQYYTLNINYDHYTYKHIISFVFFIETYTGGAHPNHDIWTINYNTNTNQFINIDNLAENFPNFLNTISTLSKEKLQNNPKLGNTEYTVDMLTTGTNPTNKNFSNLAFSKEGLLVFFKHYQIAPYSSGAFIVKIPYNELFN